MNNMKLVRATFLLCALSALLLLPTPSSSLRLDPPYSSPSQGLNEKSVIQMVPRRLMIISNEHANVMTTTVHQVSNEQLQETSSGKGEENKLNEEEEKALLSKYLSMDYPRFRRRRPVHNKALPLRTP